MLEAHTMSELKYYREGTNEFVENGHSKIRVITVQINPSPTHEDRFLKVMSVQQVLKSNPNNPIAVGNAVCLSFPKSAINLPKYRWMPDEEKFVAMQIQEKSRIIKPGEDLSLL